MKGKKEITQQDVLLFNMFRENMMGKQLSRNEMKAALHLVRLKDLDQL